MSTSGETGPSQLERLREALADRYEVERELGRGGMATVYLARDLKHDRPVAIKVMRPELASTLAADRFQQEIRVTANLEHPHILGMIDSGKANGLLYVVLPYLEGEDLQQRLERDGFLPAEEAVQIAKEVADGLDYAHRRGVVHRDIKPSNIMLSDGHARLTDFGIARAVGEAGGATLTATGQIIGTPFYMSPEQVMGEGELDGRIDIYALGCVLYAMLAGEPPYTGTTPPEVLAGHMHRPLPSVRTVRPDLPPALDRVIQRAMAKEPGERFETAAAFRQALESPDTVPLPRAPLMTRLRRRPRLSGAGAFAVILALLAAWSVFTRTDESPSPGLELEFPPEVVARRIAVLPLANLSPDPEAERYLVDGIHDEMLTRISQIAALDVLGRPSVMQFRGPTAPDVRTIGDSLHAGLILGGSVRRAGSLIRLAVQLIDVRTEQNIWADTYDREVTAANLFDLQSDVALRVAGAVQAEISPAVRQRLEKRGTENDEAYEAYLSGVYHQRQFEIVDAERFFLQAIELDPGFAAAHAQLAITYIYLGNLNIRPPRIAFPLARTAAERALELDEELFETQTALIAVNWSAERNWPEVKRRLEQALEQSPSSARAHDWYAQYLSLMRRDDLALEHSRTAWELDPLCPFMRNHIGRSLYWNRRCDLAVEHLERTLEVHPDLNDSRVFLALCDVRAGHYEAAIERVQSFPPPSLSEGLILPYFQALAGRDADARTTLANFERRRESEHVSAGFIALVYVGLGEYDRAFEWLETAREEYDSWLFQLHAPEWDPIRDDPRFLDLLASLDLPAVVAAPPPAWVFHAE